MKKIVLILVLLLLVLGLVACDTKNGEVIDVEKDLSYTIVSTKTFEIGKVQKTSSPTAFLYYEEVLAQKYDLRVASLLDLKVGDTITVLTIELSYGFSYNVIKLNDTDLDVSLHKYIDKI